MYSLTELKIDSNEVFKVGWSEIPFTTWGSE